MEGERAKHDDRWRGVYVALCEEATDHAPDTAGSTIHDLDIAVRGCIERWLTRLSEDDE